MVSERRQCEVLSLLSRCTLVVFELRVKRIMKTANVCTLVALLSKEILPFDGNKKGKKYNGKLIN